MKFDYVLEKIRVAEIEGNPFPHLDIQDVFSKEHFDEIINSPEIKTPAASGDRGLFEELFSAGYRVVEFPGCTTDYQEYLSWHKNKLASRKSNSSCEGYGVVLRLDQPQSGIVKELKEFLTSDSLASVLARAFRVSMDCCKYDAGIQKYMDGYEISPHPDIRRKAVTFMVNLNPNPDAEVIDHHTHLMKFRDEKKYVEKFWEFNPSVDRCWVPWDWCETVKQQFSNNSMVIFAPAHNTMHAVKANYDHLGHQRTQLYGNLWYSHVDVDTRIRWEDLVVRSTFENESKKKSRVLSKMRRIFSPNRGAGFKSGSRDGLNNLTTKED